MDTGPEQTCLQRRKTRGLQAWEKCTPRITGTLQSEEHRAARARRHRNRAPLAGLQEGAAAAGTVRSVFRPSQSALPGDPATPLLGVCPEELEPGSPRDICLSQHVGLGGQPGLAWTARSRGARPEPGLQRPARVSVLDQCLSMWSSVSAMVCLPRPATRSRDRCVWRVSASRSPQLPGEERQEHSRAGEPVVGVRDCSPCRPSSGAAAASPLQPRPSLPTQHPGRPPGHGRSVAGRGPP